LAGVRLGRDGPMTIRGGGVPATAMALCRAYRLGPPFGASPPMRMSASWFDLTRSPNTRLLRKLRGVRRAPLRSEPAARNRTGPDPNSIAPGSPPSRPLRAACGGGLRPAVTAAALGATGNHGRDGETVLGRTKKLTS